jgi:NADPH:quinone reductase-like Zn-dependent oxidoreductase/SAM-dependent methyltransferase
VCSGHQLNAFSNFDADWMNSYATGALSLVSACKVSYYRGQLAGKLRNTNASCPGAMISINLAEGQVPLFLESIQATGVCVACINSPLNCTLSGPEASIDAVKAEADKSGIFAQKLKTGVAYHSPSMLAIADEYLSLMGTLESAGRQDLKTKLTIPMVSSVTGRSIRPAELAKGQYWVDNMVSPVRFAEAVQVLTQDSAKLKVGLGNMTDIIEVGPHPALKRPISDTISQEGNRRKQIRYSSVLHRSQSPVQSTLELMGQLFCYGHPVSVSAVNQHAADRKPAFLADCPEYPFDHSNKYWAEPRISRDYRLRGTVKGETLGVRVSDWNELEPRWRNFLSIDTVPFAGHHMISDTVVYPAAGMLLMAIEAVQQMVPADRVVAGYLVKEATFISPIIISETWEDRTETSLTLRPVAQQSNGATQFETTIFSYRNGQWTENSRATIRVDYAESDTADDVDDERRLAEEDVKRKQALLRQHCDKPVDSNVHYSHASEQGLQYGDWFSILQDIRWDSKLNAVGRVDVSKKRYQTSSLVHPAVLDTAFHVLRVSAGSQPAANVPVRLEDAWFASSGWQHPETDSVQWLATSNSPVNGELSRGEQGKLHALSDSGKVLCTINKAVTAAVTTGAQVKETKLLYGVEWKPQLSLLGPRQLSAACRADSYTRDETIVLANHAKMCSALDLAAARTLKTVDHSKVPEGLVKHVEWMQHHVSTNMSPEARQEAEILTDSEVEARLSEVDNVLPAWKLYTDCARKLPEMLSGALDPLQLVFGSNLADIFYEDLFLNLCSDGRLGRLLDLASHENPALRFLEVGAGTGGMTGHIIKALQEREARTGSPSFAEYTYTDISPAFFERAKSRWPDLQDRMTFKTLDLDRSVDSQGFEAGSYDYIVAASVLHATPHLEENIRSISKALKPGGRLILLEVINPDDIATNFMAGLVPGWWVAREEWRPHSAAIPEYLWDKCLRENGFSGNDVVIRDYENDRCHIMSIIVSTAVGQPADDALGGSVKPGKVVFVVDDREQGQQRDLVDSVRGKVGLMEDQQAVVCPFTLDCLQTTLVDSTDHDTVICLAERNKPLLANLTEDKFTSLQYLVSHARNLLWVTSTSTDDSLYPDYSIMHGFFRTIRAEQSDSHIVTLAIEGETDPETRADFIHKVFRASFGPAPSDELEYIAMDGLLTTGRAVEDVSGNNTLGSLLSRQLQHKPWAQGPALQLSAGSTGSLDSLLFVEDVTFETELGALEVEVDAKTWGLVPRDVQAITRRLEGDGSSLGGDCAGVVTKVGHGCGSSIKPGDRVWMMTPGCARQFPRADISKVIKIPESMAFEDFTSISLPTMTAYHALVEIGRLEEGDKVLVHSAAGIMGQVAVQLAKLQGAEVFATASTPEKRQFLAESLNISKDHIFSSTSGSFARGVMRVTEGGGVDVVFNSLPGDDALAASCECAARNGRLIQIDTANVSASAALLPAILARNISFSGVDVMKLSPKVTGRLLGKTTQLLEEGKIQQLQPVRVFSASEVEEAFKELQSDNSVGRVLVAPKPGDVVPVSSYPGALTGVATPHNVPGARTDTILFI